MGQWIVGSWLTTTAVGLTGDFYFHHFVCAVPMYVTCLWVCYRDAAGLPAVLKKAGIVAVTCFAGIAILTTPISISSLMAMHGNWLRWSGNLKEVAAVLDRVMDRCGMQRYVHLVDAPEGLYGFTEHSPYGPIFTLYTRNLAGSESYVWQLGQAIAQTGILVRRKDGAFAAFTPESLASTLAAFTEEAPPCAGTFQQPKAYTILFRK